MEGSRVNECFIGTKNGSTLEWRRIGDKSAQKPCIRASHSTVVSGGKCYIFGGQDDENNKLNDLWQLDLATENYSQIELAPNSFQPSARSGHSANIHKGKMYIFGGILELTKELNEMLVYDFATKTFSEYSSGSSSAQEVQQHTSNLRAREDDSPGKKTNAGSPTKTMRGSPTKLRRAGLSPTKTKVEAEHIKDKKKQTDLASPTSISMQNSFIIKNADESFDAYYM